MRKVGRYSIVAELKRSDKQATCKAWDPEAERFVLVKISLEPQTETDEESEDAQPVSSLHENLRHDHLILPLDAGIEHIYPYSVFEFIEGDDLRVLLERVDQLPVDITTWILTALLSGLAFLHDKNILHRDIKPENIMLARDGAVKLCDFDLASRFVETRPVEAGLTGSFGYFSPEEILGEKVLPASDLFSLGVTIYELLTGARPFAGTSMANETRAITHRQHLPVHTLRPGVPDALAAFIDRLLAKDPSQRPQDASQALHELSQTIDIPDEQTRSRAISSYVNAPHSYTESPVRTIELTQEPPTREHTTRTGRRGMLLAGLLTAAAALLFWLQPDTFFAPADTPASPASVADSTFFNRTQDTLTARAPEVLDTSTVKTPQVSNEQTPTQPRADSNAPEGRAQTPVFRGKNILLRTSPWAYIFLDDDSIGAAENTLEIFIPPGEHALRLRNPEMPELTLPVTLTEHTPDTLSIDMWQHVVRVDFTITPYSEALYIDGQKRDTPMTQFQLLLMPGTHELLFVHPDLGSLTQVLTTKPGEEIRVLVNFFSREITIE